MFVKKLFKAFNKNKKSKFSKHLANVHTLHLRRIYVLPSCIRSWRTKQKTLFEL